MPIVIQIFLLIFSGLFFLGAIGEKETKKGYLYIIAGSVAAFLLVISTLLS